MKINVQKLYPENILQPAEGWELFASDHSNNANNTKMHFTQFHEMQCYQTSGIQQTIVEAGN